jgi:hypothetical protein
VVDVPVGAGPRLVCAAAVTVANGTTDPFLGCRWV